MQNVNIVIAEFGECRRGLLGKRAETFHGVNVGRDLRQYGGGVAGAGADLEDFFAALEHQGFGHEGHDIGLGNRLLSGDRKRRVLVGEFTKIFRQEQFARHLAHRLEHQFVADASRGNMALNHLLTEWRPNESKWFLAPRVLYSQRREDLYSGRQRVNEIKVLDTGFGADAGYVSRFTEFRAGYLYDYINGTVTTGGALPGLGHASFHAIRLRFVYDGQDSNVIARHGLRSVSDARWNFSTGGASQYGTLEHSSSFSKSYGPRYVLLTNLAGGSIVGPSSVFPPFSLGGPAVLTAFGRGQLRGDRYYNASLLGLRAFSADPFSFSNKVFALLGYEMGKAFNEFDQGKPVHDGVLGVVSETPIGVVFLGYSVGTNGNRKFVFRVGRLF